ncbi:MAG: hypothetical protein KIS94_01035 [Chitinophagales bacterium]|nr:hypothetical protein [Chitinophagales bacterium]
MQQILTGWNFFRVLRVIAGLAIVAFALDKGDWAIAAVGGLYSFMAVINVGCAYNASCASQADKYHQRANAKAESVTFEEIKS